MNEFPLPDPIPLPAPVWLFKALHVLTLSLHFCAVEMLLGGLILAVILGLFRAAGHREAAGMLAHRLPVVMTYVINLGVPPLLFAQVLYGRALYTSSILIGAWWIAVIFLLMLCYWLLYRFAAALDAGRSAWWLGLLAWLTAGVIARIYSTNMTLMLRPDSWGALYSASAFGAHLPSGDPTTIPRWLFMLAGGLVIAGLWMVWLASRPGTAPTPGTVLARWGGRLACVSMAAQGLAAFAVLQAQPAGVPASLHGNPLYLASGLGWITVAAGVAAVAAWQGFRGPGTRPAGWTAASLGFLLITCMTLYRDGLRDYSLLARGFDVWNRQVVTNWSVVATFLATFVAGLLALGWLISVMLRAKPVSGKVAS